MDYGEKRNYQRIDIYTRDPITEKFRYQATTTWARTLRVARERFAETAKRDPSEILTVYASRR